MFVELHILQNFAPSNLNRDESGAPKDCEFGGYRRARISSQCLKRAIRETFRKEELLPKNNLAQRTKRLLEWLVEELTNRGRAPEEAQAVVEVALRGIKLGPVEDGKTQYLLFLGRAEVQALAAVCVEHWDDLAAVGAGGPSGETATAARRNAREIKQAGKQAIPGPVQRKLEAALNGGKAADLALFGRMLADLPDKNVDAACQVAHAISTNRVSMEFDFYTAVDDRKPQDTAGADMLGTVEFNSACFYRYANVDLDQLRRNLGGDAGAEELARMALDAFVRASIDAVPTGKQHSMAAQNPPAFVLAVARRHKLWSLANAFVQPIHPDGERDLVQQSIVALDNHWGQLARMYGDSDVLGKWCAVLDGAPRTNLAESRVHGVGKLDAVGKLIEGVMGAVAAEPARSNEAGDGRA